MPRKINLKCPICKKAAQTDGADFPFCSERCRLLDLGNWSAGQYVVSSPVMDEEELFGENQLPRRDEEPE